MTFISALTMMHAAWTISHNHKAAILSSLAYLFSLYHLTDIYIRGALGEVTAMAFLPLIVSGMYLIFDQKETQR